THGNTGGDRIFASPLARKIAAERNLDLSAIQGTGPSGRIVRKDVEHAQPGTAQAAAPAAGPAAVPAASAPAPAPMPVAVELEDRTVALSNMRATIAKRLVESKTTIPHYQVTVSARLDALMTLREQLNDQLQSQGVKLSVNDFLVRACGLAMHQHPFVNSSWNPQGPSIDLHGRVNVGVAVALPEERGGGLVVATLRDADRIGLRQISAETKRLAKKARDKGLTVEEMSDSTFTISNLGMFGVDHFTAIVNPPNAAILAVGAAVEKPFVERDADGEVELVIGHEMSMTLSSDHRIIDGAMAAQYLNTVKQLLEAPASLLV
ncbi:MAG: 2-oxo acid dehydrogenase subunit E2, partial [Planctomycetota bacterium]